MKFLLLLLCTTSAFASYVNPPYEVPRGGTGGSTFTASEPLIGNGTGALSQGTLSGNTTEFATINRGALTNGHVIKIDASGNLVDGGAASSGTVTSVALSDGSTSPIFTISGSPVTTSGTPTGNPEHTVRKSCVLWTFFGCSCSAYFPCSCEYGYS